MSHAIVLIVAGTTSTKLRNLFINALDFLARLLTEYFAQLKEYFSKLEEYFAKLKEYFAKLEEYFAKLKQYFGTFAICASDKCPLMTQLIKGRLGITGAFKTLALPKFACELLQV